jgi:hypothetical protein
MRAHQNSYKTILQSRLNLTTEEQKESFMVTFTMDDEGFQQAKTLFNEFISNIQQLAFKSKNEHVYQLNFDLLKWF